MLPDIVTFWHGPMDALRQTCLRSQLAAGHKVTVYSFDNSGLPAGIGNADAEAILPIVLRTIAAAAAGQHCRAGPRLIQRILPMKLMAKDLGLWLDADAPLLRPVEIDPAKPYFAWERPRQLGNSVIYLPPEARHRCRLRRPDGAGGADAELAVVAPSHPLYDASPARARTASPTFLLRSWAAHSRARAPTGELQNALPKQSFYACMPSQNCSSIPRAISASSPTPRSSACTSRPRAAAASDPGSLYAWATERFG